MHFGLEAAFLFFKKSFQRREVGLKSCMEVDIHFRKVSQPRNAGKC
jgi:hypothetical protein